MFLLYLIGILCSLVMFAPSMIPSFVKFPVAFVVALLMVFFFNLSKRDTVYTVNEPRNGYIRNGLFSPLLTYIAASSYTLGFAMLFTHLSNNNMVDIVANVDGLVGALSNLNVILALVFVLLGVLFYALRNTFRKHAGEMTLQSRSAWYVVLTIISLGIGVFTIVKYYSFDVYEYLSEGMNLYIYFGIVAAIVFIDLVCNLIAMRVRHCQKYAYYYIARKESKLARKNTKKEYKQAKKDLKKKYKQAKKDAKKAAKLAKKQAKKDKKAAKKQAKKDKKAAKKQAKLDKKAAKKQAKKDKKAAKKQAKFDKKEAKKAAKLAKKQAKKDKKAAKKQAKKDKKAAKKQAKLDKKEAKKAAKLAKKQAKLDKKAAKKQTEKVEEVVEETNE